MAFAHISFKAAALGKRSNLVVFTPDGKDGPLPVMYLLHGLSDNEATWHLNVPVNEFVEDLPLIAVLPDGGRGFYCNNPAPGGGLFEDHIVGDVVGFIDRTFPTIRSPRGRALVGNSMGGYGAVMLALRHPNTFCCAVGLSAAMEFARRGWTAEGYPGELAKALPSDGYDAFDLAERLKGSPHLPALRLDCGTGDFLIESNRRFHRHLEALGIAHEYVERPGEHNWRYWRDHFAETLAFVVRRVGAR